MKAESVDDLYELPLSEFTAARNALAKESGDKSVAKLRKPSAAAWALNQAARKHRGDVARFLHAAANVRASADRAALAELRHTEADVRRAAQAVLGDRAAAQLSEINTLLATAASDEEIADVLRAGRLSGDEQANADGFLGMVPAPSGKGKGKGGASGSAKAPPKDEVKEARERKAREDARRTWEAADEAAKEAEEEAARLEREAEEAADKAARLRARAETAKGKAEKARQKADDLKP